MDGVLVRFGEIGIKSAPVRRQMQARLKENLLDALLRRGVEGDVLTRGARLWMTGRDTDALLDAAVHTFGVVSASPARVVDAAMDTLCAAAAEEALAHDGWRSFAIRARREGEHPFSSQDIGVRAGSAVYVAAQERGRDPEVDLDAPDLEVHVEVRGDIAYVFTRIERGPGGLPAGTQGKVALLLSDGDSAAAGWMVMRRGCSVVPVFAGDVAGPDPDVMAALAAWGFPEDIHVLPVCSGAVTKHVLFEAAAHVAVEQGCMALVTGERLGADLVAADLPVLRPLCGLDPDKADEVLARLGLGADDGDPDVLAGETTEDADALLSMHRVVKA